MANDAGISLQLDNSASFSQFFGQLEKILIKFDSSLNVVGAGLDALDRTLSRVSKSSASAATGLESAYKALSKFESMIGSLSAKMEKLTDQLAQGFERGGLAERLGKGAENAAKSVIDAFKRVWGIQSPSRVMQSFGEMLGAGLQAGLNLLKIGENAASEFVKGFGDRIRASGQAMRQAASDLFRSGVQDVTAGGIAGLINSRFIGQASDFDAVLNQIRVFGKISRETLKGVQSDLLRFAADSIFDPQQTAQSFLNLQKAGLSVKDAMDLLPESIDLATASNQSLDAATMELIRTVQGMGLPFSEAKRVIDALVGGADISTAEVSDFADSFQFAAASLKTLKIPVEDAVTAFAVLSDQFIVGERAGTGVRAMLDSLIDPTSEAKKALTTLGIKVKDAKGNFVGMGPLLDQFATAIDKLRKRGVGEGAIVELLSKLGDRNTSTAILALTSRAEDGTLAFRKYGAELKEANSAQTVAAEMMKTFAGIVESLKGSIQTLLITAFQPLMNNVLAPFLNELVQVVNWMSALPEPILSVAAGLATIIPAFVTLSGVLKIANAALLLLTGTGLTGLGTAISTIVASLFNPIGLIAGLAGVALAIPPVLAAVGLLASGVYVLVKVFEDVRDAFTYNFGGARDALDEFVKSLGDLFATIGGLFREAIAFIGSFARDFNDTFGRAMNVDTSGLVALLKSITQWIQNIRNSLEDVRQVLAFINMARGIDTGGGQPTSVNDDLRQREQIQARLNALNLSDADAAKQKADLLARQAQIEAQLGQGGDSTSGLGAANTNKLLQERASIMEKLAALNGTYTKTLTQGVSGQQSYVVKSGDTLWALAKKYGTTVDALKKLNNIVDPKKLRTGSTIKIPVGLTDEKGALQKQLDDINKRLPPGARIQVPGVIDEGMLAEQFRKIANSPLFRQLFGDAFDVDSAVNKIHDFETAVRQFAVNATQLNFGSIDLTGFKKAVQDGINGLANAAHLDLSGLAKWIQNSIPDNLSLDFSKLRANISQALGNLFSGGGSGGNTLDMEHARAAGYTGSGVQAVILNSLSTLDFSGVEKMFEKHFDSIVNFVATAAIVVLGGPIGAVIGVGKLVLSAIQNDFLGIGTKLKESGFLDAAENFFGQIKSTLEQAFQNIFNGGGNDPIENGFGKQYAKQAGYDIDAIRKNALGPIGQVLEDLKGLPKNLATTFSTLGEGIKGFIDNLKGVDASGIPRVLEVIGGILGGIGTLIVRGIGNVLPQLGDAIKNFIEIFSNLGKGDIGQAAASLLKIVGDLIGAVVNFSKPAADLVINFIEKLTGWQLPDADSALKIFLLAINQAFQDLQVTVENVGRSIEDFFRQLHIGILQIQSIGQTGENFKNIQDQIKALQDEVDARNVGSQIADTIKQQIAQGGGINLAGFVNLKSTPEQIAAQLSTDQKKNVIQGIAQAFSTGNTQALDVLLPIAAQPQFKENAKDITKAAQDALDTAVKSGDANAIKAILPFAPQFKLDTTNVPKDIQQQITDAADDASNMASAAPMPGQATPAKGGVTVPVTVTPDVTLTMDAQKFKDNLGKFLTDQFNSGTNRDQMITAVQNYAGLNPENATAIVDGFLGGIAKSIGESNPANVVNDFINESKLPEILAAGVEGAVNAVDLSKIGKTGNILDPQLLNALGISVATGIGNGITAGSTTLATTTTQAVDDGIKTPVQDSLGIHSPSDWGIEMGAAVMEGIAVGLSNSLTFIQPSLASLQGMFDDLGTYADQAAAKITNAVFTASIASVPLIALAVIITNQLADAWYNVAVQATNAGNAIKNATGGGTGGGTTPTTPPKPPGRKRGGDVLGGNMYEVLEGGIPELLSLAGRHYLMAPSDGYVTPPRNASVSNMTTNNANYGGATYNVNVYAAPGTDMAAVRAATKQGILDARQEPLERKLKLRGAT